MIGETLYIRDDNRRVYENDDGTKRSSPNPRRCWVPYAITGETRDSWTITTFGQVTRVSKKTLRIGGYLATSAGVHGYAATAQQMEDAIWRDEHFAAIRDRLHSADAATLRKIAALLDAVS